MHLLKIKTIIVGGLGGGDDNVSAKCYTTLFAYIKSSEILNFDFFLYI